MMNQMINALIVKGFAVHFYPETERCTVIITNMIQDKSAIGYNVCPEKALAQAMLHYIEGHGRIE